MLNVTEEEKDYFLKELKDLTNINIPAEAGSMCLYVRGLGREGGGGKQSARQSSLVARA